MANAKTIIESATITVLGGARNTDTIDLVAGRLDDLARRVTERGGREGLHPDSSRPLTLKLTMTVPVKDA